MSLSLTCIIQPTGVWQPDRFFSFTFLCVDFGLNSVARQYNHELWLKREAEAQKKLEKQRELEEKIKADREEREVCTPVTNGLYIS